MVLRTSLAVIATVALLACGGATNSESSSGNSSNGDKVIDAAGLYAKKCSLCHGADGKLMLSGATDLSKSTLSLRERIMVITNGRKTMAPYKGLLSEKEIEALAIYIEGFREN